ncbi:hypothetical protein [Mycolicibacterium smegmatis]|uniref:Uncharacterized protein n=1 Tax=Mycolicibacterium smegmatis (strain MKD8) TaxID=1214915 RepID=A0A2U9PHT3_MYCSE|nr:hypothetical protein [Mycolicibacterium smegmatis]AWT51292.1 hypothetical protein D806_002980 [Mycolicibacterium smegmatis MKD8]
MSITREELRALVREVVREAVGSLNSSQAQASKPAPPAPPPRATVADQMGLEPTGPRAVEGRNRTETVRLTDDKDLDTFVRKLLRLFESPKTRADLKTGRLRFRLAPGSGAAMANGQASATHRIDSGAVTERHIADLAGGTLVLGPRAVLTPLAREKARTLGIVIEKERR